MFRFVTLLCLVAPVFSWFWDAKYDKGLKVRYDVNPLAKAFGNAFMDLPQTRESAKKMEWTLTPTPELHEEFASLEVWCSKCSNVCVLLDDTGYVAGVIIAFKKSQFTTPSIYDWKVQGFRNWTTIDGNGKSAEYIFTAIYFSSPEYLKTSAESRVATRNPDTLLQDKYIYVSGINGELHPISTDPEQIADTAASNFTLQACMPWMGNHYYYEMRESLECNSRLFPFFPLEFGGKLIGLGFVGYGVYEVEKGCTNFFENPPKLGVQTIVPRGPACLYDLANNPGLITMHTYFIDSPTSIYCLPKLG